MGKRVAVDLFFRSLADTHGPHAAAIVLSGADGDGAIGIKRIKERGGLTIAQDPDGGGARRHAARGDRHGDGRLGAAGRREMPARLIEYHRQREAAEAAAGGRAAAGGSRRRRRRGCEARAALRDVLVFLRTRTGRDFSYYKRATILRRIARRMQVNGVDDLPALPRLSAHASGRGGRAAAGPAHLGHEFLPRPRRLRRAARRTSRSCSRARGRATRCASGCRPAPRARRRIPSPCCCCEHARTLDAPPALQVFASDLDEEAIQRGPRRALPGDDRGGCLARSGCGASS